MEFADDKLLGAFLRDRRTKLDPAAFGLPMTRRRTSGLRREEVAQRANVSATWYTWLEQGRGGAPSSDVLERIAKALVLTDDERDHLFAIGLGRPPDVKYHAVETVSPRLQRVLDALEFSPAYVKNSTWDLVAWNFAASKVLHDYSKIAPGERNLLRLIFADPRVRRAQSDWDGTARFVVAAFRADTARANATDKVRAMVEDLCVKNPQFKAIWAENEVRSTYGEVAKTLIHPLVGKLTLEYSAFAVDGRPDLDMVIYNPATPEDRERVKRLLAI